MPSIGTGSVDIRQILNTIVNVVKSRANTVCTAPCDGAVLKMHYRWTFFIFIGGFFTVWYQWYVRLGCMVPMVRSFRLYGTNGTFV